MRTAVLPRMTVPDDPRVALLWDPQTCGGFLAAVPVGAAEAVVAALRALGEDAACIGRVVDGPVGITVQD